MPKISKKAMLAIFPTATSGKHSTMAMTIPEEISSGRMFPVPMRRARTIASECSFTTWVNIFAAMKIVALTAAAQASNAEMTMPINAGFPPMMRAASPSRSSACATSSACGVT